MCILRKGKQLIAAVVLITATVFSPRCSAQKTPANLSNVRISQGGSVSLLAVQEDGKVLIFGSFTSANGVAITNSARINADGSVDDTWKFSAEGNINALAIDKTNLYVGGCFQSINGVNRTNLAKLSTLTGIPDRFWDANLESKNGCDGAVSTLALVGPYLFVGGSFTNIGGVARTSLAKLNASTGTLIPEWDANIETSFWVRAIAANETDLFVGGSFEVGFGGQMRTNLAKISLATGNLATQWRPESSGGVNGTTVQALAASSNALYVGGRFFSVGGMVRTNLARLDAKNVGAVDADWVPDPFYPTRISEVSALTLSGSDIYVGGSFSIVHGQSRTNLARVSVDGKGESDEFWDPQPDEAVQAIVIEGARAYVGGRFTSMRRSTTLGLARLGLLTGLWDNGFPVQIEEPGFVAAMARQPDGKLIIGGTFNLVAGVGRRNLARFNRDGTLDLLWDPSPNGFVSALAISGHDVFLGGHFFSIGGVERQSLAKAEMTGSGAVDPVWNPPFSFFAPAVTALAVSGTNLYVLRGGLFKLSTSGTGTPDPTWVPSIDVQFDSPALLMAATESALFLAGEYFVYESTNFYSINGIAKFDLALNGKVDRGWNPDLLATVYSMVASGTNLYLSAGYGGLFKMSAEGSGALDASWTPPLRDLTTSPIFPPITTILGVSDTNLYAYGIFTNNLGGLITNVARLDAHHTGASDPNWDFPKEPLASWVYKNGLRLFYRHEVAFLVAGSDLYFGGYGFTLYAVAEAPSIIQVSPTNVIILRNPCDGYEITHFRITGLTGGDLYSNDGQRSINPGDFITTEEGERGLLFLGAINGTITALSSLNDTQDGTGTASTTFDFSVPQKAVFTFSSSEYRVAENSNAVRVTVRKWGYGAASVKVRIADALAVAYDSDSDTGDYIPVDSLIPLTFPNWPTNKTFTISIWNDSDLEGDESFWLMLTNASVDAHLAWPAAASVVIEDDEAFGPTESLAGSLAPASLSYFKGGIQIFLVPSLGQWRLVGELAWRHSGDTISNLLEGVYEAEFRPLTNYYVMDNVQIATRRGTNISLPLYFKEKPGNASGRLTVDVTPIDVAQHPDETNRGQWRVLGEGSLEWHDSGQVLSNLPAGIHIVQFKSIPGFAAPQDTEVTVIGNSKSGISASYVSLDTTGVLTPHPLSSNEVTDTNRPYRFDGQIWCDAGFSSGVVVKERVVLTTAHGLFNDYSITWAPLARWFFERNGNDYSTPPQVPRGWYVLSGYASQHSNDLQNGAAPGTSTSESQQLDAAALYFVESEYDANLPGRGGFGGYLSSDAGAFNEHLLSESNKFLAGYPFDPGSPANWGKLHATVPTNLSFRPLNPDVFVTRGIQSFPGNSGGPLYVQHTNGDYYPAAIYLGGSGQARVRAIDSRVVDLINRAEASGSDGGNHSGGGVIRIDRGPADANYWHLIVELRPAAARNAGAKWRGASFSEFTTGVFDSGTCKAGQSIETAIEFQRVPGWLLPTYSTNISFLCGQTVTINATYEPDIAFVHVRMGTRDAILQGAGWQLQGYPAIMTNTNTVLTISNAESVGSVILEFKPVLNWIRPPNQILNLVPGQTNVVDALYQTIPLRLDPLTNRFWLYGTTGTTYQLQSTPTLGTGALWSGVYSSFLTNSPISFELPPLNNGSRIFYRAKWKP